MKNATPKLRQNVATRYEIAAVGPEGQRVILAYTARTSQSCLVEAIVASRAGLVELLGASDAFGRPAEITHFSKLGTRHQAHTDNGWTIGFTGRTEREAFYAQANAENGSANWLKGGK
jgi:hypothetical protein